jgi:acyl-coenzyme A synthetase/AMP-(fatty) acid ligase
VTSRLAALLAVADDAPQMLYDGTWYTWDAIRDSARQALVAVSGIDRHAAVGVVCRNHPLVLGAILGLLSDGRCILPFPVHGSDEYVAKEVRALQPEVLLAVEEDWRREPLAAAGADLAIRRIHVTDLPDHTAEYTSIAEVQGNAEPATYPEGTAFVLQTSGTTGTPKRVPVSYRNIDAAIDAMRKRAKSDRGPEEPPRLRNSVALLNTPVSHTSGMLAFCLNCVEGRRLALLDKFEPTAWAELVRDYKIASAGVPPAALAMLLDADVPVEWLSSLKMIRSGTAPLDPDLALRFEEHFQVPVVQAYGATEFQGVTAWSLSDHQRFGTTKRGSVGRPLPGVRLRVVDPETGEDVAPGDAGRLDISSSAASVTTASGWVSTNDRARIDDDGFLWILGRLDDMINRGGLKVDSSAVARALREHPSIADAAVVGVSDPRLGEVPCAAVVLSESAGDMLSSDLASTLGAHLRRQMPPYMLPARYAVVAALPLNASMKVDRRAVTALFA